MTNDDVTSWARTKEEILLSSIPRFHMSPRQVMKLRHPTLLLFYLNRDRAQPGTNLARSLWDWRDWVVFYLFLLSPFPSDWAISLWFLLCIKHGGSRERTLVSFGLSVRVLVSFPVGEAAHFVFPSIAGYHDTLGLTASQRHSAHSIAGPLWQAGFTGCGERGEGGVLLEWDGAGREWDTGTPFRWFWKGKIVCITRLRRIPPTYGRLWMVLLFLFPAFYATY